MNDQTREWLEGLRGFAGGSGADARSGADAEGVGAAPALAVAERGILGPHIAALLANREALLAARRAWCSAPERVGSVDADPAIVLTTSAVGSAVAADWLAAGGPEAAGMRPRLVAVTERDYRLWCIRHPDPGYDRHVALWSWVKTRVPRQRWPEFAAHPLAAGEEYWLHRAGIAGAGRADRRDCGLWKFDGRRAVLLASPFQERGAAPLGGGGRADDG